MSGEKKVQMQCEKMTFDQQQQKKNTAEMTRISATEFNVIIVIFSSANGGHKCVNGAEAKIAEN